MNRKEPVFATSTSIGFNKIGSVEFGFRYNLPPVFEDTGKETMEVARIILPIEKADELVKGYLSIRKIQIEGA